MAECGRQTFVTLATNDSYAVGALVLGNSLRRVGTTKELTILITDGVPHTFRKLLEEVFDNVVMVKPMQSGDEANLRLLQRPTLGITYTKLYCWRLIEFSKAVFLDADTLVLQNIDDLFEREEFSAAADANWPDVFNTGVFVFKPSLVTFTKLLHFADTNPSFDGGDQGLLNAYFSTWSTDSLSKHLSFADNCSCWVASNDRLIFYTRAPAWKKFGTNVRLAHFTGIVKPWTHRLAADDTAILQAMELLNSSSNFTTAEQTGVLAYWWAIFFKDVKTHLSHGMFLATTFEPTPPPPCSLMQEQYSYQQPEEIYPQHFGPYHPEFNDTSFDAMLVGQRSDLKNQFQEYHHFEARAPPEEKRVYHFSADNREQQKQHSHYHQGHCNEQHHESQQQEHFHEQHHHVECHHPQEHHTEYHQDHFKEQSSHYSQEQHNEYHQEPHHQEQFQEYHHQHQNCNKPTEEQKPWEPCCSKSERQYPTLDDSKNQDTPTVIHETKNQSAQEVPKIVKHRDDKNPLFFALNPTCAHCAREIKWSLDFVDPINATFSPSRDFSLSQEANARIRRRSLPFWSDKLYFVRPPETRQTTQVDSRVEYLPLESSLSRRNGRKKPSSLKLHNIQKSKAHEQGQKTRTTKPKSNKEKFSGVLKVSSEKLTEKRSRAFRLEDPCSLPRTSRTSTRIKTSESRDSQKPSPKSRVTDSAKDSLSLSQKSHSQKCIPTENRHSVNVVPIESEVWLTSSEPPAGLKEVEKKLVALKDSHAYVQPPKKLHSTKSEPQVNVMKNEYLCERHRPQPPAPAWKMLAWERGEIDYCGEDRFSNILARIRSTIEDAHDNTIPIGIWL